LSYVVREHVEECVLVPREHLNGDSDDVIWLCVGWPRVSDDILRAVQVLSRHISIISDARDSITEVNLVAVQGSV
jgi:hypothetical protein